MTQTTYIAESAKGKPVMTFDVEDTARCFIEERAQRGVRLNLVRQTVVREPVQ